MENNNDVKSTPQELIKLFIFELQNILFIIEIAYANILGNDMDVNIPNGYIFPYKLCVLFNLSFLIQHNKNNILIDKDHVYYMANILAILLLSSIYIILSIYIVLNSISSSLYYSIQVILNNNIYNNNIDMYGSNNNINKNISHIRIKYLKFLLQYHIYIISYYIIIWCVYSMGYIINIDNIYTFIVLLIIIIVIIIMNLVLCILLMKYYTHVLTNNAGTILTLRNQQGILIMLIFRIFIFFAYFYIKTLPYDIVIFVIIALFIIIRLFLVIFKYPIHYDLKKINITSLLIGVNLGLVTAWLIQKIMHYYCGCRYIQKNLIMMMGFILIFCPIISKCALILKDKVKNKIIHLPIEKLTEEEIISRYIYFASIFIECQIEDREKKISMLKIILKGKLSYHLENCHDCEFSDDIIQVLDNPLIFSLECYSRVRIHLLQSILENGLRKNPRSIKLYLLLTEFIINNDEGFHKGIIMIQNIKELSLSSCELLSYNILKIKLMKKAYECNKNRQLNIDQVIICERFEQDIINKLKMQTKYHLNFWNLLEESNDIDMDMIIKLCIIIDKQFKDIERLWINKELIFLKNFYLKPLLLYGIFLQVIKHDINKSEAILKKYYQFKTKFDHLDKINTISIVHLCSEKNVFLRVKIDSTELGDIFWCSSSIHDLIGYNRQEILLEKKIDMIMPDFFKELHSTFVKNYFTTGKQKMLNTVREIYAQHKHGYLVPIYIFITPYPHFIHGVYMDSIIRQNPVPHDIVLTTLEGKIISMTKNILIDWQRNNKQYNKTMIWEVCPILSKVILAYQIVLKKEILDREKKENHHKKYAIKYLARLSNQKKKLDDDCKEMTEQKAQILVHKYSTDGDLVKFEFFKNIEGMDELIIEYSLLINTEIYHNNQCLLKFILKKLRVYKGHSLELYNNNKTSLEIHQSKSKTSNNLKSIKSKSKIESSVSENVTESNIIERKHLMQNTFTPKFLSSIARYNNLGEKTECSQNKLEQNIQEGYREQNSKFKRVKSIEFLNQNEIFDDPIVNETSENHSKKKVNFKEESSIHTKSSEVKIAHRRVYQALETSYYPKILQYQFILVPFFLLITIYLMIYCEILSQGTSSEANTYINLIKMANQRCLINIDIYKMTTILWIIKMNYVDKNYFCYLNINNCQNLITTQLNSLYQTADYLLKNSTNIIEAISVLDPDLQIIFFDFKVRLCNPYTNDAEYDNAMLLINSCFITDQFTAINIIHDKTIQLSQLSLINITQDNIDLNYLLQNILGDIGIALNNTVYQISKNMKAALGQVRSFLTNILKYFIPICGIIWVMIMIISMHVYGKNKNILLNVARLPKIFSHSQVIKLKNFLKMLKYDSHNDFNTVAIRSNLNRELRSRSNKFQSIFTRNINMRRYYFNYIIRFGLLFIIILLILLIFLLRLIYRTQSNQDRDKTLTAIDKSIKQIYYQSLSIAYLYEYIFKNRSSFVMNQDISTSLNESLKNISSQQDFATIFQFKDNERDPFIDYILFQNPCDILPETIPNYNYCSLIGNGINQRGLINLNTYIYQTIKSIKDDFDNSARSKADIIRVLNMQSIQDLQIISYSFIPYYYNYIHDLLYLRFKHATNDLIKTGYIWIGVCTFCIILIYWLLFIPTIHSLLNEINNVKKVLKIIPKEYILANNILMKFIITTSVYKSYLQLID